MRRIFMIREFKILLLMIVLIACFGAGVVVGNVVKSPESSGEFGFFKGADYLSWSLGFQDAYVSGAYDAMMAVSWEARHKDFDIAFDVALSGLDSEQMLEEIKARSESQYAEAINRLNNMIAAVPTSATNTQLRSVVTRYIQNHPAEQHNNAALLVWRALADAEWR